MFLLNIEASRTVRVLFFLREKRFCVWGFFRIMSLGSVYEKCVFRFFGGRYCSCRVSSLMMFIRLWYCLFISGFSFIFREISFSV